MKNNNIVAKIVSVNRRDGAVVVECNGHRILFGDSGGDGFCFKHRSFKCINDLTEEEKEAIKNAEYKETNKC